MSRRKKISTKAGQMATLSQEEITSLLLDWGSSDKTALDHALTDLSYIAPRKGQIVELRCVSAAWKLTRRQES
jgi:hypothetical protein